MMGLVIVGRNLCNKRHGLRSMVCGMDAIIGQLVAHQFTELVSSQAHSYCSTGL
jgi:hypothetical protein